jgi:hypothetical protein
MRADSSYRAPRRLFANRPGAVLDMESRMDSIGAVKDTRMVVDRLDMRYYLPKPIPMTR